MIGTFLIVVVILGFQLLKAFLLWWDSVSPGTPERIWQILGIVGLIVMVLQLLTGEG